MTSRDEDGFTNQLVTLAQECAEEVHIDRLAKQVSQLLCGVLDVQFAGISILDEERDTVRSLHTLCLNGSKDDIRNIVIQDDEMPADVTEMSYFSENSDPFIITDQSQDKDKVQSRIRDAGITRYLSVPIRLHDTLLGCIFIGWLKEGEIRTNAVGFAMKIAKIVTPTLCNCLYHERFARGDRRRDVLVELSNVINSSLELEMVIKNARRVIGRLEGHRTSAIILLGEGNATFSSYETFRQAETGRLSMPAPTVHQVKGSVIARLLEKGQTYESNDLEQEICFENEHEFLRRGVRRYLTLPLLARGRILGGFLFGTSDPRPRRQVEYWLYENISLQLALSLDNAQKHEQLKRLTNQLSGQNDYLRNEIQSEQGFGEMIGTTSVMKALRADIARVAPTDATVLVTGETGVGKELVARFIHETSPRSKQPLIKINCPSIPESMFESELFGHERGAFTSAVSRRVGRFELASDGTLFLDEIGELSLAVQAKLLRVLQDGEFERVGGSKTLVSNARIIAATNRNLSKEVQEGRFREDLFYRLNVFPIHVPTLRERRNDIPALAQAFATEFGIKSGKRIDRVDPDDLKNLQHRMWPGNIRELRHVIERAVILCDEPILQVATSDVEAGKPTNDNASTSSLDAVQSDAIRRALDEFNWVIEGTNGAAVVLGLKPSTLRFRMKRLGIVRGDA